MNSGIDSSSARALQARICELEAELARERAEKAQLLRVQEADRTNMQAVVTLMQMRLDSIG